jgi:glycosyltransferase involved in cell wall biosynthesis
MKITFFHWSKNSPPSIGRSFAPLISELYKNNDVQEYYVPYSGGSPFNLLRNILFIYKHRNNDGVNHITGDIHYGIFGLIGSKSVLTIHDDYAYIKAHRGILDKIYKWIFWLFLPIKLADKVVCISDSTKNKIDKLVSNKKTVVITQHSVGDGFEYSPYLLNNENPTILQIGATFHKNLETTLNALKSINCNLRVIKKMTAEQHLLAKQLKISYSNADNLTDEEIIEEYKNADIVVFPSLYEGFGMPIIEAQTIGRPVITSNMSPMNWVAGTGALLLNNPTDINEYKEGILRIIMDDDFKGKLIANGRLNALRFNVNTVVDQYVNLYNEFFK